MISVSFHITMISVTFKTSITETALKVREDGPSITTQTIV